MRKRVVRDTPTSRYVERLHDWKGDEFGYCQQLVADGGNASVPRRLVVSYLDVQIASAHLEGRIDVEVALDYLKLAWEQKLQA